MKMADNHRTLQYLLGQLGTFCAALGVECPPELSAAASVPTAFPPLQARRNVFAQVDIGRDGDPRKAMSVRIVWHTFFRFCSVENKRLGHLAQDYTNRLL
jgi:hypothetical protein